MRLKEDATILGHCIAHHKEAPMPRGRDTLYYTTLPKHLGAAYVDGKKHVVFVSYYPNVTVLKKSLILRKSGEYYTTLIACCIREDSGAEKFFDQCYEVQDYADMQALLSQTAPFVVHAHIQPSIIGALAVVCAAQTGARVVVHVNDAMLFVEKDPHSQECLLERAVLRSAAGFSHKMPPEAIAALRDEYALAMPDACIHALPVLEFCVPPKPETASAALHIVFAGGVMPYHLAMQRGHENHVLDPLIEQCGEGGHALTVLVNLNARNMFWHEHEHYLTMLSRWPAFRFIPGTALQNVPEKIAGCSFGIHYENRPICSYNPKHFEYNMATKIFSYIEAGLSVMVSDSAPYIVEFIERYGLGFGFSFANFADACTTAKQFDRSSHGKRLQSFVQNHSMDTNLPVLNALYRDAHA